MEFWYTVKNVADIPTPALLIYPDRIEENLRRMIAIAGDPEKLRPHVKTHKMAEIITLSLKAGITRFKCSTIAEAEMVAARGGKDVMLAMQPVGPQLERFFRLQREFSGTCFSALADHEGVIGQLSATAVKYNMETGIWLDINNGMNRTGIIPGDAALHLYSRICDLPMVRPNGLHVYDGHIHDGNISDPEDYLRKRFSTG